MKYKDFRKELEKRSIYGPYLFFGEEGLMIEKTLEFILHSFLNNTFLDLNYSYLHGGNLSLDNLYSAIETLPFMSDKRLIVIDEIDELNQRFSLSETFFKTLDSVAEDTIIIFKDSNNNLKKTTKLYKYFKNKNIQVEFSKLDNMELSRFIRNELLKRGKSIKDGDISYLSMLTGYSNKKLEVNLYDIDSELSKLAGMASGETITREDINKSIKKAKDSNVFNLLDSLAKNNSQDALGYLHDLYEKNESIPGLIHMIQRRFRHFYEFVTMYEDNKSDSEIKKVLGISDYEYKTISNFGKYMKSCDLVEKLKTILEVDKLIKTSSQDNLLLIEYLVVNICK